MSESKRCKSCGNPVDVEQARDGACPWCLAAFTFSPEPVGNSVTASKTTPVRFGKYVRTEKLGAGGMGEVWKALDTELNRYVALKFLKDDEPSSTVRFQREARTAAGLAHAGIASIHEVGEIDGRHYIAMQYVQGRTMASFPKQDRRLIVRLFRDAAGALEHAHRHGVIHRDLKPDNLMVEEREDGWHVVILDFGLARPIEGGEKLSKSGEVYGTAAYMSPEQARGEHLDERADVYSLGATMYEVLTGSSPFQGTNLLELLRKVGSEEPQKPRKLNPRIHRDLETIILKCLEKDRERRYENARELAEDLGRFLVSDPIVARPPSTLYRLKMKLGKRKAQAAAVTAILAFIATAAIFIPKWRSEAGAREKQELAAREKRERLERARPHLEAGRKHLARIRERMHRPYKPEELKSMAMLAREELGRALALAPDFAEVHLERAASHSLLGEKEAAIEALDRAIAADPNLTPAYLERVRLRLDDYELLRHSDRGGMKPESPQSKALLAKLETDLDRVERFSKDYPQQKYAQALLAFAHGNYAKSASDLAGYLEREEEDSRAHYWRAHALWHLERSGEALESIAKAVSSDAGNVSALGLRGVIKLNGGDPKGAIEEYTLVLEYRRDHGNAYFNRGNARLALRDFAGAIEDYTRAGELLIGEPDPFFNRGNAKLNLGDLEGAAQDFTRAIALAPDDAELYAARTAAYHLLGRIDEMFADCERAILLDPKQATAYGNRGVVWRERGDFPRAIADYTKAIALNPKNSNPFLNRGNLLVGMGRIEEGIADLTKAIDLAPGDGLPYLGRGAARKRQGLPREAMEDYNKAVELMPRDADAREARGQMYEALKRLDEAIADHTKAVELQPKRSKYYNSRGIALEFAGCFDEAIQDYSTAISLAPKDPTAWVNRGSARDAKGLFAEAREDYRKALALAPPGWPPRQKVEERMAIPIEARYFREGNRSHELKQYREAIALYKRVVEDYPNAREAVPAAYNIACAFALLGEKKEALDWLDKAVGLGWDNLEHTEQDPDLESVRGEARFRKVLEKLKSE